MIARLSGVLIISQNHQSECGVLFYIFPANISSANITAIKRTALRETDISRHHGDPIEAPSKSPRTITPLLYLGVSRELSIGPHHAEGRQSLG